LIWKQQQISLVKGMQTVYTKHSKITSEEGARRFAAKWGLEWEFD
jgi:hypothetical protein